jgi:hypothetical protein
VKLYVPSKRRAITATPRRRERKPRPAPKREESGKYRIVNGEVQRGEK